MIDLEQEQIIVAEITPPGTGAISAIRVSGRSLLDVAKKVFPQKNGGLVSHKAFLTHIWSAKTDSFIDQVLVLFFETDHSYTGQQTLEIFCHGNPLIVEQILEVLVTEGCRLAEPGEFTMRSFLNGQLDLVQAEAVASLISAQSDAAKQRALDSLGGTFSETLKSFESGLIDSLAHLEASIDFSTENLELESYSTIKKTLIPMSENIFNYLDQHRFHSLTQEGLKIVLVGEPNAGKSTIFNKFVGDSRSIVTSVAGTTRDVIESRLNYKGQTFTIFDTAGIRDSADMIEAIGVEQTKKWIIKADVIVWVIAFPNLAIDSQIFKQLQDANKPVFVVLNKSDLATGDHEKFILQLKKEIQELEGVFEFSFHEESKLLLEPITSWLNGLKREGMDSFSISQRSRESLQKVRNGLMSAIELMNSKSSPEFVALELRGSLLEIQKILGIFYDDQVVDKIFKNICLGK